MICGRAAQIVVRQIDFQIGLIQLITGPPPFQFPRLAG
jgi:hypothetical protein